MEFEQTTASRSPERLIRQPKMAEVVADLLRSKILTGRLADGELLPRQEVLMAELGASRDVLRQGLQILEAEGLVKVRRGNVGGVEVHRPSDSNAAHMVALVLESAGTTLDDIARTLLYLEPECAALCAERSDRRKTVVPFLRSAQKLVRQNVDDVEEYTRSARIFHRELSVRCGSKSLSVLTSTMETIFSTHEAMVIERTRDTSYLPGIEHRRETVDLHDRLVELINDGNSSEARILARQHLDEGQQHAIKDIGSEVIRVATLRGWELHGLTKRSSA